MSAASVVSTRLAIREIKALEDGVEATKGKTHRQCRVPRQYSKEA